MELKQEYAADKPQTKAGFFELGINEILLMVAHEQVSLGESHIGAHSCAFNLEVMTSVEEEESCTRN